MGASGNQPTILAVVVTYNRLALLKRCLEHLHRQSLPPTAIVVVNNSSTDGTEDYLRDAGIEFITQENSGASGGWFTGIEEMLRRNMDHVWLMDDDGFPDLNALNQLSRAATSDTALLSSVVVKEDSRDELVFGLPVLNRRGHPRIFALKRKYHRLSELAQFKYGDLYPFAHLFNGALVSANSVRKAGNVEKGFFVYGEELDFLWRMKRIGGVFSHTKALHYHPDVSARPMNEAGVYYYIRNSSIIARRHLQSRHFRPGLAVAMAFCRILRRNGVGALLSYLIGRNRWIVTTAIADARDERLGTFKPRMVSQ